MNKYRIVGWNKYQHYKERNPPWVKLHYELLSSQTWVSLDDASRVLAVACMLVASRHDGCIPTNDTYMERVAYLNKKPNYKPLIDCGFLEHASTMLADASNLHTNARPETETYREETEKETEVESARETRKKPISRKTRIPEDWSLPQEWGEWAEEQGLAGEQILKQAEKFKDRQISVGAAYSDWQATWRNWIRNHIEWSSKNDVRTKSS